MRTEPISLVLCLITPLLGPMVWSQAIDLDKELRLAAAIGDDGAVRKILGAGTDWIVAI